MNKHFGWAFASALLVGSIGSAFAADMAVKARPQVAPIYNWTGGYVGGNVGGAWNNTTDNVYPTGCFLDPFLCGGAVTNNPLRSEFGPP